MASLRNRKDSWHSALRENSSKAAETSGVDITCTNNNGGITVHPQGGGIFPGGGEEQFSSPRTIVAKSNHSCDESESESGSERQTDRTKESEKERYRAVQ